jgi:hypothetical protein
MTQFLAFTLRVVAGAEVGSFPLAPSIVDHGRLLIQDLETRGSVEEATHRLIMVILDTINVGDDFFCPLSRFIVYVNVLPSGQIRDPGNINGTLTELKWPSRASAFWETVLQFKEGRHGGDPNL